MIDSVEYIELSFAATDTTKSANLTKGQTIANCVPFVTKDVDGSASNYDELYIDVQFQSGPNRVTATRQTGTVAVIILGIFVVEFDSAEVKVQQGTFSIATATGSGTAAVSTVDQAEAAMVFYYLCNGCGTTLWGNAAIRGYFSSNVQLTFDRQTNQTGAISGHWFVFEDIGTNFGVAVYDGGIAASVTLTETTITSVTMNKTFLIESYRVIGSNDDAENYAHYTRLLNATTLEAERLYAKAEAIESKVFVVSLTGDARVFRGLNALGSGVANFEETIAEIDLTMTMAWNPGHQGLIQGDGSAAGNEECAFVKVKLNNSTTVRGDRTSGQAGEAAWEVVEWVTTYYEVDGVTYDKTGTILGSVECYLFKDNLDNTLTFIGYVLSHATTGVYSFDQLTDNDAQYLVVFWKDDTPHVFDVTDHVLQPVAV